jgi:hypothetical protein
LLYQEREMKAVNLPRRGLLRKRVRVIPSLAAFVAASFAAIPAMAVAPGESWLVTQPGVEIEGNLGYAIGDTIDTWTGTPAPLSTNVSLEEDLYAPTAGNPLAGLAKVDATGSATWASAASGSVGFNNDFALSVVQPSILFFLPVGYDFNSFWQYSFTPATDATFTMSYDVSAGGLVSADFGGWFIQMSYGSLFDQIPTGPAFFADGSGIYSVSLLAGQTYTASVFTPGVTSYDVPVLAAGDETAQFDWNILESSVGAGAVPEPSTWAMLLIGFAGLGFATYCRRTPPVVKAV